MKNTIITILIIVLALVGLVMYLNKDKVNKTSSKVKETVTNAVKQVKEDVKD